ncbi:MAG: YihY/virulence factor BrkB family protein [Oscillospiraceae bacterium]|nr:YihY/virulence factor BrkB family protein [Oscillospiraceae bacterium]
MDKLERFNHNIAKLQHRLGLWEIANIAAATAFWFFLSIVPLVILAVSILPYTPLSEDQLLAFLSPVIPASLQELITGIVSDVYQSNLAILSVSIVATIWSAARGFSSLIRGLEEIYRQERRTGFLLRRARGVVYTLGMVLFSLLSVILNGFGNQLIELVERYAPYTHGVFIFLLNFRFLVVIAMLTLYFTAIFVRGTGRRLPIREALPGALFAATGWSLLTWVFSVWLSASTYGTYGSLATVVVVMLWLYYCQYVLLLGACINRALFQTSRETSV